MEEITIPDYIRDNFLLMFQNNIDKIEASFDINVALRGNKIMFEGEFPKKKYFKKYISHMFKLLKDDGEINENDLLISLSMVHDGKVELIKTELNKKNKISINGRDVYPKSFNQKEYINGVRDNDLTICIGPAGTGKTFLAIAIALNNLLSKKVKRIVLTRPVVEAGEKLGFLPGDIHQKVNPYFRPLYDSLYSLIGFEKTSELVEKEIIEIAPLAYMRGRTIDNAFIILDEGQNILDSQMKMFLTRFGFNSKVVMTADVSQIDLPDPKKSGVFKILKILKNIENIRIIHLSTNDIVRHPLVQKIIEAYDKKKDED